MLISQDLIGCRVVRRGGELLGVVSDLIVNYQAGCVVALTVRPSLPAGGGDWVVPLEAVYDFPPGFVVLTSADDLVLISKLPHLQRVRSGSGALGSVPLLNAQGRVLGTVTGVRFDSESGALLWYELSVVGEPVGAPLVVSARQVECQGPGRLVASPATAALLGEVTAKEVPGPYSGGQRLTRSRW